MSADPATAVAVPSKIVIVGTSTISLNQRFSKMPKQQKVSVRPSVLSQRKPKMVPKFIDEGMDYIEDGLKNNKVLNNYVPFPDASAYDPRYAQLARTQMPVIHRARQPVYRQMPVPIDERVTFTQSPMQQQQPRFVYVPVQRMNQRNFGGGAFQRGFAHQHSNNNRFGGNSNANSFRNVTGNSTFSLNGGGFNNKRGQNTNRFGGPSFRGGRGNGFNNNNNRRMQQQKPKKTQEQLDRELDEYMKKPSNKHTPITI